MKTIAIILSSFAIAAANVVAQGPSPVEQRLREQLRSLTQQLQASKNETAVLQADKTKLETKVKELEGSVGEMTKKMQADQDAALKEREELKGTIAGLEKSLAAKTADFVAADAKWKETQDKLTKTEEARKKLADEKMALTRLAANQRSANQKMFEIGNEILTRYEKFGLGTALTSREPFVGITRARLQSLVEEYGGRLSEQRLSPNGTTRRPPADSEAGASSERPADGKPAPKKTR